jgi:hypothetical protein
MLGEHPVDVMLLATDLEVAKGFAAEAADLRSRGVELQQVPGLEMVDGIADIGFALAAWFVDPGRNSIGLLQLKSSD